MSQKVRTRKVIGLIFTNMLGSEKYIRFALEEKEFDVVIHNPPQSAFEETLRTTREEILQCVKRRDPVIALIEVLPNVYGPFPAQLNELAAELFDAKVPVMRYALGNDFDAIPEHLRRTWILEVIGMERGPLEWAPELDRYRFR